MTGAMDAQPIDRDTAESYATWFRALSDPTRVQILNVLALAPGAMSVGEIVERVGVGQSTVSHHLKLLADVRFVFRERQGTSAYYSINVACIACFPRAADVVMGRPPSVVPNNLAVAAASGPVLPGGHDWPDEPASSVRRWSRRPHTSTKAGASDRI
jgi:DNA-binding transcriptional ArsR family regulator